MSLRLDYHGDLMKLDRQINWNKLKSSRLLKIWLLGFFILTSNCEGPHYYSEQQLSSLQSQDIIEVLILNQPLSFTAKGSTQAGVSLSKGLDFDLLSEFANFYGKKIKFIPFNNESDLIGQFQKGHGHIAAGRFPKSYITSLGFNSGPDYEAASLSLFCHRNIEINGVADLTQKKVITFERYNQVLSYQNLLKENPLMKIDLWVNGSSLRAFKEVQVQRNDCLIALHSEGLFFQKQFPNVEFKMKLKDYFSLNWMIQKDLDYLNPLLKAWFQAASRDGSIIKILDRYRLISENVDKRDINQFIKNTKETLPDFVTFFKQAGKIHELPWELIAAVAYQESKWIPHAKSFTGVEGFMQITKKTAKDLGIIDIHNVEENIMGGAKYLKQLIQQMPPHLNSSDKVILALAAYNIGIGHLNDAFKIAISEGKNPYQWHQLRQTLPKLTEEKYFKDTQFGEARGYETIDFVERVKVYYHYLIQSQFG